MAKKVLGDIGQRLYEEKVIRNRLGEVKRIYSILKEIFKSYGINSDNKRRLKDDYQFLLKEIEEGKDGIKLYGYRDIFGLTICNLATTVYNAFEHREGKDFAADLYKYVMGGMIDELEQQLEDLKKESKKAKQPL
jgi:hypothetical protein